MKKWLFFLVFILPLAVFAQDKSTFSTAMEYIQKMTPQWQLESSDVQGTILSSEATSDMGITYLYLNQTCKGIPVRNAMAVIVVKDGEVFSANQNFVQSAESKINATAYKIGADAAIINAAQHLGLSVNSRPIASGRNNDGKYVYEIPELTDTPVTAALKYELVDKKLILVWNLSMDIKSTADYWDLNIDAVTGEYVSKHNYTLYCNHEHHAYTNNNNCNEHVEHIVPVVSAAANPLSIAKYNVYALPVESPIHGSRTLVGDELYKDYSPFGWHDTDGVVGPEFTITRGNNVHAYQDKEDRNIPDSPETEGGNNLNFDYPLDLTKDPRENADAAVTNLFYMNNMIHDITYKLGFNEEFGNFQQNNYTGKGDGRDYVQAQAFDGITLHENGQTEPVKINNANFSTPIDGFSGRMQMYLWTNTAGIISIDEPENIKGFINKYGEGRFGKPIPNKDEPAVSAKVAVSKASGVNSTAGCTPITNASDLKGKIAIIDRGVCDFSNKVYNVQQAGAIAAIVCNISGINGGTGEEIVDMGAALNSEKVTIPSIFMKKSDCDKIRLELSKGTDVVMTFQEKGNSGPKYYDGALDNGIIAHEYGHGISTRLTGGRLNSSCLFNDEQMGEGWSDFFAMVLTHKPGDKGSDARGMGNYASGLSPNGRGIRRYPYSTDMTINPQTYKDIRGTTEPHPVGEVWADILWDMYWKFVDSYGFDPDWNNETSGNFLATKLVIEALKIQPCNPDFITGRNAILKADSLLFNGKNGRFIWESFARRGVGYYASAGNTRNDNVEDFSLLPTLKITKTATTSIDPGADVDIAIHAINHIPSRQNQVIITDELPEGMTYIAGSANIEPTVSGNVLVFELGDMDYKREIDITYRTRSDKDNKSVTLEKENFDGRYDWETENIEGSEEWITSYDIFKSPDISYSIFNGTTDGDASLISIPYNIRGKRPVMRFWHRYNTQNGNDGGMVLISVNGGPYNRIPKEQFIRNPYNTELVYGTLVETGIYVFSGNSGGGNWNDNLDGPWIDSYIDLSAYTGQNVSFKFRFVCDEAVSGTGVFTGWYIDDFEIIDLFSYHAQACISAENGAGEKACTDALETFVNPDNTVSTKDIEKSKHVLFRLEPNPADDYVSISLFNPLDRLADISIVTLSGKEVYKTKLEVTGDRGLITINTSKIPAGMYLVNISTSDAKYTEKLIIK